MAVPKSIVFITGAFLSNNCWDEWKLYFESKGYNCLVPTLPCKLASAEELRNRHPDAEHASIRLSDIIEHFASIANGLPEKPILVGHSLGGLIVQLLLQRNLGTAGVAMHSFPPRSVGFKFSFLKSLWKAMGFYTSTRTSYMISFKRWKYKIANGTTFDQQKELYYKYAVPESKLVIRDCLKPIAKINFNNAHPPLLFTAGDCDKTVPPSLNYRNYKKYGAENSIADYRKFKGRNHLVFDHLEWKEEAEFIRCWLEALK